MEKLDITHDPERYENIFNMYQLENSNGDKYAFYNILSKVSISDNLDDNIFEYYIIDAEMPLTTLSFKLYKTQHLWWLIMVINKLKNPVKLIKPGSVIKAMKIDYLDIVFNSIKQKI